MASSEFRRQQSRVWWSSFHGDEHYMSLLGSPIPRSPAPGAAPGAAPVTPAAASPAAPAQQQQQQQQQQQDASPPQGHQQEQQGGRDASSSPSTSHKSQDSGFSDSDGSHRAAVSPLSSSPEVTEGAQLPTTPSPSHTRLQLCLSGACTSTPRDGPARGPSSGPTSFGGHATPGELRRRLSQDDSCIQSRPLPAIPAGAAAYRRQRSAEEARRRSTRALLCRSVAAPATTTTSSLDTSLEDDDEPTAVLNQTFPLAGPPESGHRAPRCFIKNRKNAAANSRRQQQRFSRVVAAAGDEHPSTASSSTSSSTVSDAPTPHITTVVRRPVPDGGEDTDMLEAPHPHLMLLDVTTGPGLPAHTSTPKAAVPPPPAPAPQASPMPTPTRRPLPGAGAGAGRRVHDRLRASARPVNLLNNYEAKDETAECSGGPAAACARLEAEQVRQLQVPGCAGSAVAAWLGGLRSACEPECSVTLQSKALLGADARGLRQLSGVQLASPQGLAQLQRRAHLLSGEYTRLCGRVQRGSLSQVGPMTETLVSHVLEFLQDHAGAVPEERAGRLRGACERLHADASKEHPEPADMAASLAAVRAALTATVDAILEKQVQELVNVLEGPASPLSLRTAVSALCALGRQGSALSDLVVRCGGVRALLQVVLDARTSHTRRAALRALSAVCCTARSVRSLEQAGGVEVVAELLAEAQRPEEERAEAAAVLAQITAPWVPDNARVEGLAQHLDAVVHALTRLVREASSGEVLLLAAAALAHLSYVESSAVWPLLTAGAAGAVLQAVRAQGARCSVFLQEQAATLVANMSAVPEARAELAAERAVVALLCFLQLRPSPLQRAADIAAAERVQHKAAIALSRMASDPEVARQVVSLEGVPRLVRLCRDEKERNHSDGVLVACLAALRKIAANCESVVLSKRDRRELLKPRLLDSFMLFSTRQESYV